MATTTVNASVVAMNPRIVIYMRSMRPALLLMFSCVAALGAASAAQTRQAAADTAWRAFWDADSEATAQKAAQALVAAGVTLDDARMRLAAGRGYTKQRTGRVEMTSHL